MLTPPRATRVLVILAMIAAALAVLPAAPASALTAQPDTTWMTNGEVWASVQYGNVLFIGGDFTQVRDLAPGTPGANIVFANNLAAIDMTTGQGIPAFHPDVQAGGTQSVQVHALAMVGDELYVGGQFSAVDGAPHFNLAAIDIDPVTFAGTVDPAFTTTVGVPGAANESKVFVYEILPASDGLFIGGALSKVNGKGRSKMGKLNFDGTLVKTWKATGVNGAVRDMAYSTDGQTIFVAGAFNALNGVPHQSIARISTATGADDPWTVSGVIVGGSHPGMTCWSLAVTTARLFAGCGRGPNFAAAFRLDNGTSGNMAWSFGTVGNVQAIRLTADEQHLIIGGHFGTYLTQRVCGSQYLKNLGMLNNLYQVSGGVSLDCGFLPQFWGVNPFGGVWEIQLTPTAIWAGGEFHMVNCFSGPAKPGEPASVACPGGRDQESIARFTL
jgi:hypothetical protein